MSVLNEPPGRQKTDRSEEALATAACNAARHGLSERFETRSGSWCEALGAERFDAIVSNPPYIASATVDRLDVSPLGAGALAGSTLPLDREHTARALGFDAQCLYVRLVSRVGPWFREDKLQYAFRGSAYSHVWHSRSFRFSKFHSKRP